MSGNLRATLSASALIDQLYIEMLRVMGELRQLHIADYDLDAIRQQIITPVAHYLHSNSQPNKAKPVFIKPIFVSGAPGIGKTTLLMILDEALQRLEPGAASVRKLVGAGAINGYFPYKKPLAVSPLRLFERQTAVLSARDWNNILRHWTYDEETFGENPKALAHLFQQLRGKVVLVDEAEIEGYVYFAEKLAQQGILILFTSNLGAAQVRLAPEHFTAVHLTGIDHRNGNLAKVCLPSGTHPLFDQLAALEHHPQPLLAGADTTITTLQGLCVVHLAWHELRNKPLMKDDFGHFFRAVGAQFVLLDTVPFFADPSTYEIGLTVLGHLARFVNFVDAIHDAALPLLVRGTHEQVLDSQTAGHDLEAALRAYDTKRGGNEGKTAIIEWGRCLSRLRSREVFNLRLTHP